MGGGHWRLLGSGGARRAGFLGWAVMHISWNEGHFDLLDLNMREIKGLQG